MMNLLRGRDDDTFLTSVLLANRLVRPILIVPVAGSAAAWQIIVSRNGKFLLINSADCTLRLYNVDELSANFVDDATVNSDSNIPTSARSINDLSPPPSSPPIVEPRFSFQDNISRAPWASCDFYNGDEYVCGGCNSYPQPGESYKLFLWNCITGELVDQLTGPVSSLYSLSCHPTRPFIAVGTSDGIVDVWGARLDWVAFAPDFQALQQNEVYEEREDEFDIVDDDDEVDVVGGDDGFAAAENDDVDIVSVAKVPIFDSDSDDETAVFYFGSTVEKILSDKQPLTHQH
jgi:COMPASS component SWD1